eukprot:Sspe_Gene.85425::Locus_56195_Transcript_2_2_Confidence_0.667_Length_535::g.85425::m.85425/K09548/PFDN1; prefoldin subunit 1
MSELQERQKHLMETQARVNGLKQQMQQIEGRMAMLQREAQKAKITEGELSRLSDETNTYKSVGKMFVLRPRSTLVSEQTTRFKTCEEEIKKAESTHESVKKHLTEAEKEFEKLYQQFAEEANLAKEMKK